MANNIPPFQLPLTHAGVYQPTEAHSPLQKLQALRSAGEFTAQGFHEESVGYIIDCFTAAVDKYESENNENALSNIRGLFRNFYVGRMNAFFAAGNHPNPVVEIRYNRLVERFISRFTELDRMVHSDTSVVEAVITLFYNKVTEHASDVASVGELRTLFTQFKQVRREDIKEAVERDDAVARTYTTTASLLDIDPVIYEVWR